MKTTMKTMMIPMIALLIGIGASSFTTIRDHKKAIARARLERWAKQVGRERFCCYLACSSQSINRNMVLDPNNYTQTRCSSVDCYGSGCVCAIYAFPNGGSGKPIINSAFDLSLYTQLADFAGDGIWDNAHGWVDAKDE